MKHWYVLGVVLFLVGCCSGTTTTEPPTTVIAPAVATAETVSVSTAKPPAPTTTAAKPATKAETEAVKSAVRAYSAAFLGGHAKEAWLMRTPAARSGSSYAEFALVVETAKTIYADVEMTSLEVAVTGDTASATYTYDIAEINQTNQAWVKQGDEWLVDN